MVRDVLAAAGAALLSLAMVAGIAAGEARNLVQGWYLPLLTASALLLLLFSAAVALQAVRSRERWYLQLRPAHAVYVGAVLAPAILGVVVRPGPLGGGDLAPGSQTFTLGSVPADASRRDLYQWAYAFATQPPAQLVGEPVDLIGFVHRDGQSTEEFLAARFVVACCVADATGYTIPVGWPGAGALANDGWVRIEGAVALTPDGVPFVRATVVTSIDAPSNPYVYP